MLNTESRQAPIQHEFQTAGYPVHCVVVVVADDVVAVVVEVVADLVVVGF